MQDKRVPPIYGRPHQSELRRPQLTSAHANSFPSHRKVPSADQLPPSRAQWISSSRFSHLPRASCPTTWSSYVSPHLPVSPTNLQKLTKTQPSQLSAISIGNCIQAYTTLHFSRRVYNGRFIRNPKLGTASAATAATAAGQPDPEDRIDKLVPASNAKDPKAADQLSPLAGRLFGKIGRAHV